MITDDQKDGMDISICKLKSYEKEIIRIFRGSQSIISSK